MGAFFHHLFRALSGYVQRWTQQDVPNDCQVLHDFGTGRVPASPVDRVGVRNDTIKVMQYPIYTDTCGIRNDVIQMMQYPIYTDNYGVRNDVVSMELIEG
jgi:hypothetical protein